MTELTDCYLTQSYYSASHDGQLVFVIKSPVKENFEKIRDIGNSNGPFNLTIEWPGMDNSKKVELKPCPFCGRELERHTEGYGVGKAAYRHPLDTSRTPCILADVWFFESEDEMTRWNRRVNE